LILQQGAGGCTQTVCCALCRFCTSTFRLSLGGWEDREMGEAPTSDSLHLSHGWRMVDESGLPEEIEEFIRLAVRSIPKTLAKRLGFCRIFVSPRLADENASSEWTRTEEGLEIRVAIEGVAGHDLAMEILFCLGQALWETAPAEERTDYLGLLQAEVAAGIKGEIDEEALSEKRALFSSRVSARSRRRLERYAQASYANTVAEYIHCLWHDVTLRNGPEHLPAEWLGRRLEMAARWFPPDPGQQLFSKSG
jgi:hypothetical protein